MCCSDLIRWKIGKEKHGRFWMGLVWLWGKRGGNFGEALNQIHIPQNGEKMQGGGRVWKITHLSHLLPSFCAISVFFQMQMCINHNNYFKYLAQVKFLGGYWDCQILIIKKRKKEKEKEKTSGRSRAGQAPKFSGWNFFPYLYILWLPHGKLFLWSEIDFPMTINVNQNPFLCQLFN